MPEPLQGRIPVRIVLRRVNIPTDWQAGERGKAAWLWDCVKEDIHEALAKTDSAADGQADAVLAALQDKLQQAPGGLILLDGLDEVPAADQRRLHLLQAIDDLVTDLPEHTRFIVTARPYAYTDPAWRLKAFAELVLTPFDKEQRAQFIKRWYAVACERFALREAELKQRVPDLLERVESQAHLRELAERPLLLTLIAVLHASGGRLPEDRVKLYEESVNLLLFHWRQEAFLENGQPLRLDGLAVRNCLQTLAYNAHKAQQRQQADPRQTADIGVAELYTAFEPILDCVGRRDLLAFLQQHTGILIAREQRQFAFPHRSFQEYLAMGWLTSQQDDCLSPEVCADSLWWREVFVQAVIGLKDKPIFAKAYIKNALEYGQQQGIELHRLYVLAGLALQELNVNWQDALVKTVRQGLVGLLADAQALDVSERAEAGRVLAGIGDGRPGVGLNAEGWPDIAWVAIPGGEVVLEDNKGRFMVEPFAIARYPITNAQFQCFIDDQDGYANPRWWEGLAKAPGTPDLPYWPEANHPRGSVSWFGAMAFCAWLTARLGQAVSLPTEWQWQQAACGGRAGFDYPWGGEYRTGFANINETWDKVGPHNVGRTTAVGIYPQGDSVQGASDLICNIWELCLNAYWEPGDTGLSGTSSRVLRGGAWDCDLDFARVSVRLYLRPDGRGSNFGFRVCCPSPL